MADVGLNSNLAFFLYLYHALKSLFSLRAPGLKDA